MASLENMMALLRPTGLYSLADDSLVVRELKAYAVGLDRLAAAFGELVQEAFVQTAQGDGLRFWERKLGLKPLVGDTNAERRRLLGLLCLSNADFTKAALLRTLAAMGAMVDVQEFPQDELIYISGKGYIGAGNDSADIVKELCAVLPAHLECGISLQVGSWYFWDSRGKSFAQWAKEGNSFADYAALSLISTEL